MWFYKIDRDEKRKKLIVEWNTTMTYFTKILGVMGVVFCFLNMILPAFTCLGILAILLGYYLYKHGSLVQILHAQERLEKLHYTGSRYSFKNPLIVTIPLPRNLK